MTRELWTIVIGVLLFGFLVAHLGRAAWALFG